MEVPMTPSRGVNVHGRPRSVWWKLLQAGAEGLMLWCQKQPVFTAVKCDSLRASLRRFKLLC